MSGKEYVRITFLPAGTKRRRTTWAYVVRRTASLVTYRECKADGEPWFSAVADDGTEVDQIRLVVVVPSDSIERPARMNLKYAELELAVGEAESSGGDRPVRPGAAR